jgi:hypothetical protein
MVVRGLSESERDELVLALACLDAGIDPYKAGLSV